MTRFDASEPTERRKLFADAVTAHRERASPFLTAQVAAVDDDVVFGSGDGSTDEGDDSVDWDAGGHDGSADGDAGGHDGSVDGDTDEAERAPPWIQFGDREFNVDCTDAELDRLETLLNDYPEFRIDQLESPDEAEATNVRITARSDANRLAEFAERAFREVYEQPADYRLWITEV